MTQRCKHIQKDGFHTCGSYAFNLWSEGIEQGSLCDVHYWQQKAQRPWVGLSDEQFRYFASTPDYGTGGLIRAIEAELKGSNT
jgi:hypothetical protein